ncbi:hypothetical protein ABZT17_11965 [Streptomyces sp. NPDC005648]|uniref:hypothetical protein n=1 Tax=Streptomyces sp. NPDC005648 TaxID=3157044 RepID=UPI0033A2B557
MIIVYTPTGGEPQEYDARSLRVSEVSIAQRTAGMKWGEIEQGLDSDDPEAMRVIVWVIKKRAEPTLRYGDFDPLITEMTTRMSRQEVTDYVDNAFALAETDPDVTTDHVVGVLQRIIAVAVDPEHAEQLIAEKAAGPKESTAEDAPEQQPPPEESSPSSTTPTSTSSEATGSGSSPTSSTSHPELSTT